jgi:hypothetical protein
MDYCNRSCTKDSLINFYFSVLGGQVSLLRLVWGPASKTAFTATSAANATAGTGPYNGAVAISNLSLLLAKEDNQEVKIIDDTLREGMSFYFPYVWYNKRPLNGTSQSITFRYNRMHGLKLKKIYVAPYNAIELNNTIYDRNNMST